MFKKFFVNYKDKLSKWMVYTGILFAVYMMFMHFYITSDYIPFASLGGVVPMPDFNVAASGGRFLSYITSWIFYLLSKLNVSYYQNVFVIQIMGILLYAWTGTMLHTMVSGCFKEKGQKYLVDGAILLCFINPFMVETYVYGSFEWAVGIWLAVFAVGKLVHKKYILGLFLSLCATSVYQTNIFIVLIVWLLMIFMENHEKDIKRMVKHIVLAVSATAATAMCSILLQKLVVLSGNTSSPGKEAVLSGSIVEKVESILRSAINVLWSMQGMLPRRSLFVFCAVLYCMAIYVLVTKKKAISYAVVWTIMLGILFLVPFSYGLVMMSRAFPARTILSLFFSVSVFLISVLYIVKDYVKITKVMKVICGLFAAVVIFYTETCILDCYIRQALDFNEAMCIQDEIREYEEATGIEIKTVSAGKSPKPVYCSLMLHLSYDTTYNYRIMHDYWAQTRFLNYVAHENYEVSWMDEEEYEKYFGTQSWEVFNPSEQLHFEGDTLYWAIY
ncbi:MAG: glucosyltransferase domain-containing protein [Lachnospiraceae bacterium]|nr:glucosyltransferase domain-containing protein [Lachnospiraceae bacterium]